MQRNITIDIAKAICIILVVVGHYWPEKSPSWYILLHNFIYGFHMPLFMFASGFIYIATKKEESYWHFIKKKIKRILMPYFSVSVLIITIKLLTQESGSVDNPVSMMAYLRMFFYPEAGYFLWFVWALWWIFVILPLFKKRELRAGLFVLSILMHYVIPFRLPSIFCFDQAQYMFVFFMLGVMCCDYKDKLQLDKIPAPFVLSLFFIMNFLSLSSFCNVPNISALIPYIGIAGIIQISYLIQNKLKITSKIFVSVASSSYIIYLFHTTFEGFAKSVIRKFPPLVDSENSLCFLLGAVFVILIGILAPIALHKHVIQKSSISRFLFGLK